MDFSKPRKLPDSDTPTPMAVYRGESSRSCFRRGNKHIGDYLSKDPKTRKKSVLWRHTVASHGGVYGPGGGLQDYGMVFLSQQHGALDRQVKEGRNIEELEQYEYINSVKCLNSKLEFQQSCKISLDFRSREKNDT